MKGAAVTELVITGALAIGASIGFLLTYLTPQISAVSDKTAQTAEAVAAIKQQVTDIDENVKLLVQHQGLLKYQTDTNVSKTD